MRKKRSVWFWYLLSIFFFIFLGVKVEPLKTINEMYSAPPFLVVLVFFVSVAIGVVVGLRKGKSSVERGYAPKNR
jgi:Kef-type K+ transport system membrane component KefB